MSFFCLRVFVCVCDDDDDDDDDGGGGGGGGEDGFRGEDEGREVLRGER